MILFEREWIFKRKKSVAHPHNYMQTESSTKLHSGWKWFIALFKHAQEADTHSGETINERINETKSFP